MKRKVAILCTALLLLSVTAFAANPPDISESLFVAAKQAVVNMANGDFEQAAVDLTFADQAPTADDLRSFAAGFSSLSPDTVQSEISVAYWNNTCWMLAVPVTEPTNGNVEAMVFSSTNGTSLGSCSLMLWSDVESAYEASEYVLWNKEYAPIQLIIIADGAY